LSICSDYSTIPFHPSIIVSLSGSESRWQQTSSLAHTSRPRPGPLLLEDSEAFPGQPGDIIPPACPGSSQGLFPVGHAWKTSQR
ncbi:hypothetical protein LDENG_00132230, partial [Lucifuga dentata]